MILVPNFHFNFLHAISASSSRKYAYYKILNLIFWAVLSAFEIPLLYRLTGSIRFIVIFYVVKSCVIFLAYLASFKILINKDISRFFYISTLLKLVICLFLIIFFEDLASQFLLLVLATLQGIESGFFSSGDQICMHKFIADGERDSFNLKIQSLLGFFPALIPLISGYFISNFDSSSFVRNPSLPEGYFLVIVIASVIGLLSLLYIPRLNFKLDYAGKLKVATNYLIKRNHFNNIKTFYIGNIASHTGSFVALGLINFLLLKTEENIGAFYSGMALVSSFYFLYVKRALVASKVKRLTLVTGGFMGQILSRIILVASATPAGLFLKEFFHIFLTPLKDIIGNDLALERFEYHEAEYNAKIEDMLIFKELLVFLGRLICLVIVVFLTEILKLGPLNFLLTLFVISGIAAGVEYFALRKEMRSVA